MGSRIGTMVVLWGVSGLVNIDFNVGAVIAVVFGAYIVINALKGTSE